MERLPAALDTFVGREGQVTEVEEVLASCRLLALTGPPGVGKSRLALEVAARVEDDPGQRVVVVSLAPVEVGDVGAAIGAAEDVGLSELVAWVAADEDEAVLLVVDNCEHVIQACAGAVEALLGRWRGLRVLATSREPLRINGEIIWSVAPLSVPAPGAETLPAIFVDSDAVRLFYGRAAAVQRGFLPTPDTAPAVAALCRRLDGLPLPSSLPPLWCRCSRRRRLWRAWMIVSPF